MVLRRLPVLLVLCVFALAAPPAAVAQDQWDGGDDPAYVDPTAGDPAPSATAPATTTTPPDTGDGEDPWGTLPPALPTIPVTKMVPGKVALLRTDGKAAIPRAAPKRIQALIAAANHIIGKPYLWGGGHAKIADAGYDCSGAVSYALIGAQLRRGPLASGHRTTPGLPRPARHRPLSLSSGRPGRARTGAATWTAPAEASCP
jgi:cell wall-associated NlpC family hydrolase